MLQLSQRALTASAADGELFVDRSDELTAIERALELGFSVYVSGPAGSGKTSLLRRLEARLGKGVVFVNMSRMETFRDLMAQLSHDLRTSDLDRDPDHGPLDGHVSDSLTALRAAALEHAGDPTPIVLVDGLDRRLLHELFGRQRDELWEIPLRWVVTGRTATLEPPADTFFETTVPLAPLAPAAMRELLNRRAVTGNHEERGRLEHLAESLPLLLDPTTPRQLLATARRILLSADPETVVGQLHRRRNVRVHLSPTAGKVLDAIEALGPTHAGDEQLLTEIGTTRSRIVQVFKELEDAGLVRAVREGKRKLYGPDLGVDFVIEDPDTGDVAYVEVKRHAT